MKLDLSEEQKKIINSSGDIKINAVAGSGKTTTVIEYARSRSPESRILYLAFNRSVKMEAAQRFAAARLQNVTIETAHSLAYKHIVPQHKYKVRAQGYKTSEIIELLQLKANSEKNSEFVIASHILRLISCYCNSDKEYLHELNYSSALDGKASTFVKTYYHYIEKKASLLLDQMHKSEIGITHDFYLKKFQLSKPRLAYDYILFDEGQDASAAMLDIFLKQRATKVIVGDTHQQIYSWRFAVNSLEKAGFAAYDLSTSFRFGNDIAGLARCVLGYKKVFENIACIKLTGAGKSRQIKTRATIARSNLGLLLRAIDYIDTENCVNRIYFEGNLNSYAYADDGTSLYDVLNLYNEKRHLIKDKFVRAMKTLTDLKEYAETTQDPQLGMMVEIVKKYGNGIPHIMKKLKAKHVSNENKHLADMIFSTVHRSKGMEYDEVHLADDFLKEKYIEKAAEGKQERYTPAQLNEEINLLYVAITRARVKLFLPESIVPKEYVASSDNIIITNKAAESEAETVTETEFGKSGSLNEKRIKSRATYLLWDNDSDTELALLLREGADIKSISEHFGRTKGAIRSRIKKLALEKLALIRQERTR